MSESKLFIIGNSGILHNANEFLSKYWLRYKQAETPLEVLIRPKKLSVAHCKTPYSMLF